MAVRLATANTPGVSRFYLFVGVVCGRADFRWLQEKRAVVERAYSLRVAYRPMGGLVMRKSLLAMLIVATTLFAADRSFDTWNQYLGGADSSQWQSFTEQNINPFLSTEQQDTVRQMLRNSRKEGLFTPPSMQGTVELPGHNGGANWGSSAVDPTKGTMYIVSKELPTYLKVSLPGARGGGRGGRGGGGGGAPAGGRGAAPDGTRAPATPTAYRPPDFVAYDV